MIELPQDFKEFLKLLNDHKVRYLLVGGFAVGYHGFPRGTVDIDLWVPVDSENDVRLADAIREFGFHEVGDGNSLFPSGKSMLRFGIPPNRIEVLAQVSGVEFDECYARRELDETDGIPVPVISLEDLRANKSASARPKDIEDLNRLPR